MSTTKPTKTKTRAMTRDEVRYLRKRVHLLLGVRKTFSTARRGLDVSREQAEELDRLAETFIKA